MCLASAQIIDMRETGLWETDWIVISSGDKQRVKPSLLAGLFTFGHALKTFTRDKVVTRFRLTQDQYPD